MKLSHSTPARIGACGGQNTAELLGHRTAKCGGSQLDWATPVRVVHELGHEVADPQRRAVPVVAVAGLHLVEHRLIEARRPLRLVERERHDHRRPQRTVLVQARGILRRDQRGPQRRTGLRRPVLDKQVFAVHIASAA